MFCLFFNGFDSVSFLTICDLVSPVSGWYFISTIGGCDCVSLGVSGCLSGYDSVSHISGSESYSCKCFFLVILSCQWL